MNRHLTHSLLASLALTLLAFNAAAADATPLASATVARAATGTGTPAFDQFRREVESKGNALTKWWSVKAQLVRLNYSDLEVKQIQAALKEKCLTASQAELFRQRWLQASQEVLPSCEALLAYLNGKPVVFANLTK